MGLEDGTQEFEVEVVDDTGATPVPDNADGSEVVPDSKGQTGESETGGEQDKGEQSGESSKDARKRKAQERIAELTRLRREEERRRVAAERERDTERERVQQYEQTTQQERQQNANLVYSSLQETKELLEAQLQNARKVGDFKAETSLQDKLDKTRHRLNSLQSAFPNVGSQQQPGGQQQPQGQANYGQQSQTQQPGAQPQQGTQQASTQDQSNLPDAARDWIESNAFLQSRQDLHGVVNAANQMLTAAGKDPSSPEFYKELNRRLKNELPQDVASQLKDPDALSEDFDDDEPEDEDEGEQQPAQQSAQGQQRQTQQQGSQVAGGERTAQKGQSGSKRRVKLTREQVQTAQNLGLSPEQYAKQLQSQQNANGYTVI